MEQVSRRRLVGFRPAFAGVLLLLGLGLAAGPPAASALDALASGDAAYANGDLAGARAIFHQALSAQPGSFALHWRLARVESELGEDAEGKAQKEHVMASVGHSRAAIQAAPDSALGHAWLAATLGRQAMKEGPKSRLALSREIKSEADRSIAMDPGLALGYHVRALWNRKVASLNFMERAAANTVLGGVPKGASMDNAVRDLQKAMEIEPWRVIHRLELGRTLAELKRHDEARTVLERALALPPTTQPRDPIIRAQVRALLLKLPAR